MTKAREVVDRLLAQGVSVEQTARKAGVTVMTVNRWRGAQNSHNIPISRAGQGGSNVTPHHITWQDALDAAWDARRRAGGRDAYRKLLARFSASFSEPSDPMPGAGDAASVRLVSSTGCRCDPSDIHRSPCTGHVPVKR